MNRRGFTLVELVTTFALASVIIVILINVVLIIKNMTSESDTKTKLLIDQSILSNEINSKLKNGNIVSYDACTDSNFCYEFTLSDGEIVDLKITDNSIKFGNYVYKLYNGVEVLNPQITKESVSVVDTDSNNSFLVVKIPIKYKLYPNEDYGINLVYMYNSNTSNL